jgi:class 3 adenylate cyclase/predicted ATPase
MDVGGWLRGLGLGKYEAAFLDNGIGEAVLPHLTIEDLKEIGVATVGDRRMLLAAIAALATPTSSESIERQPSPALPTKAPEVSAERRPITVMFCDLVGSTSLAAKLDAEEWRNLVNAYLDAASAAVTGLGGHVLKKLGDGLMALFGYPRAQENDAERALRAALAIQRALAELNARNAAKGAPQLAARIGLDSGPVVVDGTGEVFGDAPNVAARVQAAAEPGTVLVTTAVQRQVAGLFVAEDKGQHELKGVPAPVILYRIVRASGGRRSRARALAPLIGRAEELDLLMRRWERARSGQGQFVQIVGEPGIGKSRLVEEFHARLGEAPYTWAEFSSSQLLQNTPLYPIAEWGRLRFGDAETPASQRFADLENTLQLVGLDPAEYAPLIAPLVDIPLAKGRAANLPPEELRRRQLTALIAWFLAGARSQPAALAFEDLHWADPTSLDLMQALAERGAQAPLLILATTRPEFRPPWSLRSHHSMISLSPLDRADVALMVAELAARHAFSKEVVEGVSERTGGVPLFVEEVTRLLLERGEAGGLQAIPPTLQQSLAARLDRLGEAREVAQIGAVLGRDFSYALLQAVGELADPTLQFALDRLVDADLLFVEGAGAQATYSFKHALIQDAAYESLLKSRRQPLHRRAAEILRDEPERAAAEPEIVAHHFTEAGLDDLAIEWWGKAGDQALRRSAFQEAIAHLGKAIEIADRTSGASQAGSKDAAAASRRLKLQNDYGLAVTHSKGYAAAETEAAFALASELASKSVDFSERFAAAGGQFRVALIRGELRLAHEVASKFLQEAEGAGRGVDAGTACGCLAIISYYSGNFAEARTYGERALDACDPARDQETRVRYGYDTGTVAMCCLAQTCWQLGEVERARELIDRATRRGVELGHAPSLTEPLAWKAFLEVIRGDAAAALSAAEALEAHAREHGMMAHCVLAELFAAWPRGRLNDPATGVAELKKGLAAAVDQGSKLAREFWETRAAELEAESVGVESALARVKEALALTHQGECRFHLSFLHRVRGDLLLKRDPVEPPLAEEAFSAAIAVAKEQGARSYHLLAALPLAKLRQSTGRPVEAHAILAPALEGFSPTPEMPEIGEAQALLAALAETEEVKADAARRERRLRLQTSYGQAVLWSKGFAAEETETAFARAAELEGNADNSSKRLAAYDGQCSVLLFRGKSREAEDTTRKYLHEAEAAQDGPHAAHARTWLGLTLWVRGKLSGAESAFERVLVDWRSAPDGRQTIQDWIDPGVHAASHLAQVVWVKGDFRRYRELSEQALMRAAELGHVQTTAHAHVMRLNYAWAGGDPAAVLHSAEGCVTFAREHGMEYYANYGEVCSAWARFRLSLPQADPAELRQAIADHVNRGNVLVVPHFLGLLAGCEADAQNFDVASSTIEEALSRASETGQGWANAFLHRIRGDILLKRDPVDPALAEVAYKTAIAVAREQGARSWELLAALSLAKLYQSTGRPTNAHAVLAPALEGFSPTPEMPEIAEAQALLAALA